MSEYPVGRGAVGVGEAEKAAELLRIGAITEAEFERLTRIATGTPNPSVSVATYVPAAPDPLVYVVGAQAPKLWWLVALVGAWSVLGPWWLFGEAPTWVGLLAGTPLAIVVSAFALVDGTVFACAASVPPKRLVGFAGGALGAFVAVEALLVAVTGGTLSSDLLLRTVVIGAVQLVAMFVAGRLAGPRYGSDGWKYALGVAVSAVVVAVTVSWLGPNALLYAQNPARAVWLALYAAPHWVAVVIACMAFCRGLTESGVVPVQEMRASTTR